MYYAIKMGKILGSNSELIYEHVDQRNFRDMLWHMNSILRINQTNKRGHSGFREQ